MTDYRKFPQLRDAIPWGREAIQIINRAIAGKMNVAQEVTLTANAATTTLTDDLITTASVIGLMPMSANAAAALSTTSFSAPTRGSVVINHANNAQVDKTFRYSVLG